MHARVVATLTLVGTLLVGLLFVLGGTAEAKDKAEYLPAFEATYPDAKGTRIDNCNLCHFTNAEGKWDENNYAGDFEEANENFRSIESLDSDGDGFTNLQEIQAGTFPGVASDNPSTVVTTTTVAAPPGSGAAIYQANCAGCHGGGGGNLLGRGLTLSRISSVVTNGTSGMPAYSGSLTSSEIQLVSEYVLAADSAPTTTTTTAPGTPPPPPPDGSAVYAASCAGCHGAGGGNLVGRNLTVSQVSAVTKSGTTGMPGFTSSLSSAEIDAVSSYVSSVSAVAPTTTTTVAGAPPPSGSAVYSSYCSSCHGSGGGNLVGRNLSVSKVSAVTKSGTAGMPGFTSTLSSAQIDAVSSYVASVSAAAPTTTTTAPGSPPPSGSAVFADNCAACHGSGGGDLAGHSLTNSQLRSVTADGRGSMPGFGSRLSSAQIDAVVAYLSSLRADSSTSASDTLGVDGSSLYTKYCSACHGAHGQGGAGGPLAGTTLTRSELISVTSDGRDSMPSYSGRMTTDEITAVADFILGLSGDTVADAVAGGDTEGGHLYATLCAACHGATGEGGIGGAIIGADDDAAKLAELIRNGDDGMPGFPDLTEAELDSLVAYTMDVMAGRVTVNEVTEDDASEPDETATADRNDNRSAAPMFLDNTEEGGKSPLIVVSMLVVLVGIAGTIGFMWLRTAKALVE